MVQAQIAVVQASQGHPGWRRCRIALALLVFSVLDAGSALAARSGCPEHFWQGSAPTLINPKLSVETQDICYSGYALLHSGLTLTPLWSAEHLTRDRVEGARSLMRANTFHPDPNLPEGGRAEIADYSGSGFDRGHMAPSGDMDTPEAMDESFSLANMVPQNPDLNRDLWERIERATRDLAMREGEIYVVTGPIFQGRRLKSLDGRVLVPTQIYKAVYDPVAKTAGAYLVQNRPNTDYRIISLDELQQLAGIDVFPALPQDIKQAAGELPPPVAEQAGDRSRLKRPPSKKPRRPTADVDAQRITPEGDFVSGILDAISEFGSSR